MKKSERQAIVEQIINENVVDTQEQLLKLLKEKGVDATQATISRDVRDLQIVKGRDESGQLRYMIMQGEIPSDDEKLDDTVRNVAISVTQVQFLNVIKTLPSNGNVLAAVIDDMNLPQVVGTIAGHDTVVVISHGTEDAQVIYQRIHDHIEPLE